MLLFGSLAHCVGCCTHKYTVVPWCLTLDCMAARFLERLAQVYVHSARTLPDTQNSGQLVAGFHPGSCW